MLEKDHDEHMIPQDRHTLAYVSLYLSSALTSMVNYVPFYEAANSDHAGTLYYKFHKQTDS